MSTKISIIGAGSACFSISLMRDICLTPNLYGSTISFMDVDEERLNAAYLLCRRYAAALNAEFELERTTDRRASLAGAGFVINTALVPGNHRLHEGMALARRHGYRWGGSMHVMHDEPFWANFQQLRLFQGVIEDALEICPEAWHLLVANPVLAGTTYLARKYPQLKLVGLCHGFNGVYDVAEVLGLDRDGLTFELAGVNHFLWLTRLYHHGQDAMPLLDDWIAHQAPGYWETVRPSAAMGPKAVDLYRRLGAFPIGDTCTPGGGAWPWWYHTDTDTEARWREDPEAWWNGHFSKVAERALRSQRLAVDETSGLTAEYPPAISGETMIPLIESMVCDIPRVFVCNIQNTAGMAPGIPRDFAVEIPALASKRGIQGIATPRLPEPVLIYLLQDRVAPVNLELEAYERGDKNLLLQLILMDPWTRSEQQARALLEEVLALPENGALRAHYT